MMFYEDKYISPLDLPTDYQKNFYNLSLEINGITPKETMDKLKDLLSKEKGSTILPFIEDHLKNDDKENKTMEKRIRVGDLVTYTLFPNFNVGVVIEEKPNDWFVVKFPNLLTSHLYSIHIKDLSLYKSKGLGLKAECMYFDDFPNVGMPDIVDYNYNEDTTVTTIEWSDGTKTTVRAENPDTADQHTGFMAAYDKKAAGNNNTINNLYDEWAVKKPAREMKAQIEANAVALEEQRIAKKRKAKKEKWLIRKRAAEIAKEYEARKIANEKYGVPMDYKAGDNN